MSRDKFEEWLNSLPIKPDLRREYDMYKNKHVESRYRGWLAGRESMRDEATNTARFFAKNSATARSIVEAIKSIEP